MTDEVTTLKAEIAALSASLAAAVAGRDEARTEFALWMHGMQDGALLRDLKGLTERQTKELTAAREENERLRSVVREAENIVRGRLLGECYRQWPQYGQGNRDIESEPARLTACLADAIAALQPRQSE